MDELNACLKPSFLCKNVKILNLSKNMRVELQNPRPVQIFWKQLIDIGNDKIPVDVFPVNFCQFIESKTKLMQKMFPKVARNYRDHFLLSVRAILAAKWTNVNEINSKMKLPMD